MKRFVVQVCAILLCTGMAAQELFALSINDQDILSNRHALSIPISSYITAAAGLFSGAGGAFAGADALTAPCEALSDSLGEMAACHLFGTGSPERWSTPCSIDRGTMCVTGPARIYPVVHQGRMPGVDEPPSPVPCLWSMVLMGLALISLSAFWKHRSTLAIAPGAKAEELPVSDEDARLLEMVDRKNQDKPQSLAA
jgi:hypothetical protein